MCLGETIDDSLGHRIPKMNGAVCRRTGKDPAITTAAKIVYTSSVMIILLEGCKTVQCLQIVKPNCLVCSAYQEKITTWMYAQTPHSVGILQH
jgi:hypothetical protein